MAIFLASIASVAACKAHDDASADATDAGAPHRLDLNRALCDGRSLCEDFDRQSGGDLFLSANVKLVDCLPNQTAILSGSWTVADAGGPPFEWQAEVRFGGVFPSTGHVATNLFCVDEHRQVHSPDVGMAADPDGFEWAKLDDDDVFVPFHGKATLDREYRATAVFDGVGGSPRATISVEGPNIAPASYRGLGKGDRFPWGGHRAAVVRVVAPQDDVVGTVGWVEVHLSDEAGREAGP